MIRINTIKLPTRRVTVPVAASSHLGSRVPCMNPSILGVIGPGLLNQVPTLNPKPGAEHQSPLHPT